MRRCSLIWTLLAFGCFAEPSTLPMGNSASSSQGSTSSAPASTSSAASSSSTAATSIASTDPTSSGTSGTTLDATTSSTSAETTDDGSCPAPLDCQPLSNGWTPVVRTLPGGGCPPTTELEGTYLTPPEVDCTCDCMPEKGFTTCSLWGSLNTPDCPVSALSPGCEMGTSGADPNHFAMQFFAPDCYDVTSVATAEGRSESLCRPRGPSRSCGGDSWCVPQGQACVIRDGHRACPNAYPERTLLADGYEQPTCQCSGCTYTCEDTVTLYTDTNCQDTGMPFAADGQCEPVPGNQVAYSVDFDDTATCNAGDANILPSDPDGPRTLCCVE